MCDPIGKTSRTSGQGAPDDAVNLGPAPVEQRAQQDQADASGPALATVPPADKSDEALQAWRLARLRHPALGMCRR